MICEIPGGWCRSKSTWNNVFLMSALLKCCINHVMLTLCVVSVNTKLIHFSLLWKKIVRTKSCIRISQCHPLKCFAVIYWLTELFPKTSGHSFLWALFPWLPSVLDAIGETIFQTANRKQKRLWGNWTPFNWFPFTVGLDCSVSSLAQISQQWASGIHLWHSCVISVCSSNWPNNS